MEYHLVVAAVEFYNGELKVIHCSSVVFMDGLFKFYHSVLEADEILCLASGDIKSITIQNYNQVLED